jgi:hypothetical protein
MSRRLELRRNSNMRTLYVIYAENDKIEVSFAPLSNMHGIFANFEKAKKFARELNDNYKKYSSPFRVRMVSIKTDLYLGEQI